MTKKDIAKKVAAQLDIPHLTAIKAVQAVSDEIVETVVTEGRIELRNVGHFRGQEATIPPGPQSSQRREGDGAKPCGGSLQAGSRNGAASWPVEEGAGEKMIRA
jgi:hypothetical protein